MASASAVTSKCFIPANLCVNCERKSSHLYKKYNVDIPLKVENSQAEAKTKGGMLGGQIKLPKKKENVDHKSKSKDNVSLDKVGDSKVYIRCTGCLLMSYCDETCQKEHWNRVHRFHCDFISGKKVSDEHSEDSCEECIVQETTSKDELRDINSPKTGCSSKEESKRMKKELAKWFRFHGDGPNEFACVHPFPIGNIQGNAVASVLDEMIVHAAQLCKAFVVKSMNAKEEKDTVARLLDLHKSILESRVQLWVNIIAYGDILWMTVMLGNSKRQVEDKLDTENPWWKALNLTIECIRKLFMYQEINIEMKDIPITDTKLSEKIEFFQNKIKNVALISEKNLWHQVKLWPKKVNNSLVLLLPNDVLCADPRNPRGSKKIMVVCLCTSCNADLSGQVVGDIDRCDPSNQFPSLFSEVANTEGITATCSPVQNLDCGRNYVTKYNYNASILFSEEENELQKEYKALLEKSRKCHLCLKWSLSSHRCKGCHAAQYCSVECQREDWHEFHKTVCSTWAKDPTRRLMSSAKQEEVTKKQVTTEWVNV